MKRVPVLSVVFSVAFCSSLVACSSDPAAEGGPAAPGTNNGNADGTSSPATDEAGSAPSDPSLLSACTANFDALLARVAKCGPGSTMNLVPLERSRPSYEKLCSVQGSRPGTGYTAAFRTKCAEALASAACNDDDAIVKACWEPRGELARGLPCNTDDQCKDGLCELPPGAASGSSCGVCGTPVWKQTNERCDASDKDKCEPASECASYGGSSSRSCLRVLGIPLGEPCNGGVCRAGLTCKGPPYKCEKGEAPAAAGQPCGSTATNRCEPGTFCDPSGVCMRVPGLDEATTQRGTAGYGPHCDSWTTESATGKCIVKEALTCN